VFDVVRKGSNHYVVYQRRVLANVVLRGNHYCNEGRGRSRFSWVKTSAGFLTFSWANGQLIKTFLPGSLAVKHFISLGLPAFDDFPAEGPDVHMT
jgi:hypothetical protein